MTESDAVVRRVRLMVEPLLAVTLALAMVAAAPGCHRPAKESFVPERPLSPGPSIAPAVPAAPAAPMDNGSVRADQKIQEETREPGPAAQQAEDSGVSGGADSGPAVAERKGEAPLENEPLAATAANGAVTGAGGAAPQGGAEASPSESPARGSGSSRESTPGDVAQPANSRGAAAFAEPAWVREKEELRFRIRFLGVTVGHATFSSRGKVMVDGKETYLLSVRAETSGALSMIYPVKEAIDYYIDPRTLAPVRQEYIASRRGRDNQVVYDQEKGRIVYRDRATGAVSRKVDAVPNVYDPVTVAYYFRSRDLGAEDRAQAIYAGRKVWAIATRFLGVEKIDTPKGRYETVLVQPIIMRDGRVEDKGTLRMWMTKDDRHVPVRVYAKFRKILDWTLVGELVPDEKGS